jgi:MoaA/NifB/PqqE/SkfB family radical SAM enzyme
MKKTTIELVNGDKAVLIEDQKVKILKSENYNFLFDKSNGFFCRWGKSQEDDGDPMLGLPEIADIEISTACKQGCAFCYKGNTSDGENMSLETFKKVFAKLPKTVTQIAFGITDIDANPDMWDIFDYTRSQSVVPNVTINGSRMTPELYDRLAKTMGAVAVSVGTAYNKDNSYNAIKELTDRGMRQVNIHNMICLENFDYTMQVMKDTKEDPRLKMLNALVLLSLKPKGRAENRFHQLPQDKFNELSKYAIDNFIRIGFDSCSSHKFFNYLDSDKSLSDEYKEKMKQSVEPCESGCYSSYIDTNGFYFPCSFTPDNNGWNEGISVLEADDFLKDIWQNEKTVAFRTKLVGCGRNCPLYTI